jgi:hypothetical protein
MDLSAADTVYALLLGRKYKQAETVKKDLRVSDKKCACSNTAFDFIVRNFRRLEGLSTNECFLVCV